MTRPSEDELISRFFAPLSGPGGLGLSDDAALLSPPSGHDLVLTADGLVAGIHFFPDDPPASIARKALGVNLSDLAAKGADPVGYLLTLALPHDWTETWIAEFCEGLARAGGLAGCDLLGGDTVGTTGPLTLSITAVGQVPAGHMVHRTTAAPGQLIAVTGTIGDAGLGLALCRDRLPDWARCLAEEDVAFLIDRYRHPRPRTGFAAALRKDGAAAMDVSDGFAGDLAKLLRASRIGGLVELDRVPLSPAARLASSSDPELFERLLSAGDDYEVLLTLEPGAEGRLAAAADAGGFGFAIVGRTRTEPGLVFTRNGAEIAIEPRSFSHF